MGQRAAAHPPPLTCYCQVTAGQLHIATCCRDKLLRVAGGRHVQVRKQMGRAHRAAGWVVGRQWRLGASYFHTPSDHHCTRLGALCGSGSGSEPGVLLCCPHCTGLTTAVAATTAPGLHLSSMLPLHRAQNHCRCHRFPASHPYCHHCHPRPLLLRAWCGDSEQCENGEPPGTAVHPLAYPPGSPSSCPWWAVPVMIWLCRVVLWWLGGSKLTEFWTTLLPTLQWN